MPSKLTVSDLLKYLPAILKDVWKEYSDDKELSPGEIAEIAAHVLDLAEEDIPDKYKPLASVAKTLLLELATFLGEEVD